MEYMVYPMVCYLLIGLCWVTFLGFWIYSAIGIKKTISIQMRFRGFLFRLVVFVILVLLIRIHAFREILFKYQSIILNPVSMATGVILCALGVAFAIWARVHIGKNWGRPMSVKENPELVTSGPYQYVRHPIYSGMLCAMLGSALVIGLPWLIVLIVASMYFVYSAKNEENLLTEQFPDEYPLYKKRTKMLVPFLF